MDKQKQIEEMAKILRQHICEDKPCDECNYHGKTKILPRYCDAYLHSKTLYNAGYRKIPENAVVIDRNENPCLSCPVPEDIQRDVDCSTICGSVRLGIDWQNQCKVLVKENKQLTKELAQVSKETAEKFAERLKEQFADSARLCEQVDGICKEITEGKV